MKDAIDWHKFDVSDPRFETNGLRMVTVKSRNLRGRGDITFWVPPQAGEVDSLPLVILLHGAHGSHWAWTGRGGAHLTAQRLVESGEMPPMALVMPSDGLWGDGTGYLTHARGDYEQWIAADVPAAARRVLPAAAHSSPMFIAGLSMGGYGALRLAAKYGRNVFRAASGMSSGTRLDRMLEFLTEIPQDFAGVPPDDAVLDVALAHRSTLPPLRFDCGVDDVLLADNRALHKALTSAGIPHQYFEFPGGHDWAYWSEHLTDTLKFFASCLAAA